MSSEYLSLRVKPDTIREIREVSQQVPDFMTRTMNLAGLVDRGEIYQKIGDDFVKVSIRDIKPLPAAGVQDSNYEELQVAMEEKWYDDVSHKVGTFSEWFSRAIAFRLRAVNMPLYRLTEGEYERVELAS